LGSETVGGGNNIGEARDECLQGRLEVVMGVLKGFLAGKGPWPMTMSGALMMVMLWAGPWRAADFWVMLLSPATIWSGVGAAEAKAARPATTRAPIRILNGG
jgi:hypothetical protein